MMRKLTVICLIGVASVAWAQNQQPLQLTPPGGPGPRQPQEPALQGEQKLRWVVKQLRLDEQQAQQAEALIAVYIAETERQKENMPELLNQIKDLSAQMQQARTAGDNARLEELKAEMRDLTPGRKPERGFYEGLEQILRPEQKEALNAARKRAEAGTIDVTFRPVHVLRAARSVNLTAEQLPKLEALLDGFRSEIISNRPPNDEERKARVDKLVVDVRAILTPEQAAAFDKQIEDLRETVPAPTPVELPVVKPPAPPETPGVVEPPAKPVEAPAKPAEAPGKPADKSADAPKPAGGK